MTGRDDQPAAKTRGTAKPGAVDWIAAGLAGLFLISATACASPGTAPAAAPTTSPTTIGSTAPSPAPTVGKSPQNPGPSPTASAGSSVPHQQPAFAGKALDVLATIPVKGRAPKTGYSRDQFGQAG